MNLNKGELASLQCNQTSRLRGVSDQLLSERFSEGNNILTDLQRLKDMNKPRDKRLSSLHISVHNCILYLKLNCTAVISRHLSKCYWTLKMSHQRGLFQTFRHKLTTMRCIRPPQSQFGTIKFLKTSVWADGSQHIHQMNRINSFYTKSLNTFGRHLYNFVAFRSENLVFGFLSRKTFL